MAERRLPSEEDFPNNSQGKSRIEKVQVTEPAKLRGNTQVKHSAWRSVRDEFISEDAPSVGNYILWDILIPSLKDMLGDILHGSIDVAFGTDSRRSSRSRRRGYSDSYVSYNRMYDDRDYGRRRRRRDDYDDDDYYPRSRRREEPADIGFDYREDADDILEMMLSYLEKYDEVPVSYFYDKIGRTIPGNFTDEDWGWTDLSRVKVVPHRGRWYIDFPKVRPL